MSTDTRWLLTPSGQQAGGQYIDATLRARAAERGMLSRLTHAGDFPRQRVEAIRSSDPDGLVNELYYRRGWTDGLPIIAPTLSRVDAALEHISLARDHVIAELDPLRGLATLEKVVANAVMAGCTPALIPLVVAAVQAVARPEFNLRGVQTTDENVAPVLIFSGPAAAELDINHSFGCLGPGHRGGATVGRALRFVMANIGGGWPGAVSLAGLGQPARFTLCFAEDEVGSPWPSLREEYGFAREDNVLTVLRAESVCNVTGGLAEVASIMGSAVSAFSMPYGGYVTVVLSPFTARQLAQRGWSKDDVKTWLHQQGRVLVADFEQFWLRKETIEAANWPVWLRGDAATSALPVVERSSDITLVVAGGDLPIAQQAYLPTWGFPVCRLHQRLAL